MVKGRCWGRRPPPHMHAESRFDEYTNSGTRPRRFRSYATPWLGATRGWTAIRTPAGAGPAQPGGDTRTELPKTQHPHTRTRTETPKRSRSPPHPGSIISAYTYTDIHESMSCTRRGVAVAHVRLHLPVPEAAARTRSLRHMVNRLHQKAGLIPCCM